MVLSCEHSYPQGPGHLYSGIYTYIRTYTTHSFSTHTFSKAFCHTQIHTLISMPVYTLSYTYLPTDVLACSLILTPTHTHHTHHTRFLVHTSALPLILRHSHTATHTHSYSCIDTLPHRHCHIHSRAYAHRVDPREQSYPHTPCICSLSYIHTQTCIL